MVSLRKRLFGSREEKELIKAYKPTPSEIAQAQREARQEAFEEYNKPKMIKRPVRKLKARGSRVKPKSNFLRTLQLNKARQKQLNQNLKKIRKMKFQGLQLATGTPKSYRYSTDVERDPLVLDYKNKIAQLKRKQFLASPQYRDALRNRRRQLLEQYRKETSILKPSKQYDLNLLKERPDSINIMKTPNIFKTKNKR